MPRSTQTLFVLGMTAILLRPTFADERQVVLQTETDTSTLQLYFVPKDARTQTALTPFRPEVAKLFVDDAYVGDAIVNLLGHIPILKFKPGQRKIAVRMSDGRSFESKVVLLGNGSKQILVVDFEKTPSKAHEEASTHALQKPVDKDARKSTNSTGDFNESKASAGSKSAEPHR